MPIFHYKKKSGNTSTGFDDMGFAVPYDMASEAGCDINFFPPYSAPFNPSSDVDGSWIISASTTLSGVRQPYVAFCEGNDEELGCWHSNGRAPQWLQWQNVEQRVCIKGYSVLSRSSGGCVATAWELHGSDDGSTWTTIDSVSGESSANNNTITRAINNETGFFYHRIYITAHSGDYVTIGFLQAWFDESWRDLI